MYTSERTIKLSNVCLDVIRINDGGVVVLPGVAVLVEVLVRRTGPVAALGQMVAAH